MKGIFLRKKFSTRLLLLFLFAFVFIGSYIFLDIVGSEAVSNPLVFLIVGILMCLIGIVSSLFNLGAFIQIDEDSIKAKYHWFGKIGCKLSDVTFAVARLNTLTIQLKDGKTHTIMGVGNAWSLASIIREKIPFEPREKPEVLIEKLNNLKSVKKSGLIYVCSGMALMFINIFITVFFTREREFHEFTKADWMIVAIMGTMEIITVIATFYFAHKTGKNNIPIENLHYSIKRTVIETKPLLPGFVIAVYADENYTGRITVFGYPHRNDVYYSVQKLDREYNLVQVYISDSYEDQEDLPDGFEALIDITEKVLH